MPFGNYGVSKEKLQQDSINMQQYSLTAPERG